MTSFGHQLNLLCPNDVTTSGVQSVCDYNTFYHALMNRSFVSHIGYRSVPIVHLCNIPTLFSSGVKVNDSLSLEPTLGKVAQVELY